MTIKKEWYWILTKGNKYLVLTDTELKVEREENIVLWKLLDDGYEIFSDSRRSFKDANKFMKEFYPEYTSVKLETTPITFKVATEFINKFHRHHIAPQGHKFSVAITDDNNNIVGVAIAGRPVSRFKDDKKTLEVTRCCVKGGYKNGCSVLYSTIKRIAKEFGYKKVITYTLENENGASLLATGFNCVSITKGKSWSSTSRPREDKHPLCDKKVWEICIS